MAPDDPWSGAREPRSSEVGDTVVGHGGPLSEPLPEPPRAPVSAEDAYAATIAPMPSAPTLLAPPELPSGTSPGPEPHRGLSSDAMPTLDASPRDAATAAAVAAAVIGLPPLPIVSEAHYKAEREIARGGMGRIIAAEDQRLGRPVALKELLEP